MFTQEELKLLFTITADLGVKRPTNLTPTDRERVRSIEKKVAQALRDGERGGIYRSKPTVITTLIEPPTDDGDLSWLDEDDDLIKQLVITEEQKLVSARGVLKAVQQRNDELLAKLAGLEDVRAIQQENERLRTELAVKGAPEAHEEIEVLKRACESANQDNEVLTRQVQALKTALHAERVQRECFEVWQRQPTLGPAQPTMVAILTGPCTCTDPGTLNPTCPRHGQDNGALKP